MNAEKLLEKIMSAYEENDVITIKLTRSERELLYNLLSFLKEITTA